MSAHTPGPWQVDIDDGDVTVFSGGVNIAKIHGGEAEYLANAQLIAAAPEMLEALTLYALPFDDEKEARAEFGHAAVDRDLVRRSAIAKATGSPA
jgi:hypothetical protein